MIFKMRDGVRNLAIHTVAQVCQTRLVDHPERGLGVMFTFDQKAKKGKVFINLCILDLNVCFFCGESSEKMLACGGCKSVRTFTRYCSKECQEAHWEAHKPLCGGS